MSIEQLKENGYYLLITKDSDKKMKQYEIVKDESETEKSIYCELNRAGYLKAKNEFGFTVKSKESSFLNFIPFAEREKSKEALMEIYKS